jgi:hypothetical protein
MCNLCSILSDGGLLKAISRTGHNCKDVNTILEYLIGTYSSNLAGGQLLAGYDKRCEVFPSDIKVIRNADNKDQIAGIQRELFDHRVKITEMGNLQGVADLLFSVQLRHLGPYIEKHGRDIIVLAIFAAAKKYRVKEKTVLVRFGFVRSA